MVTTYTQVYGGPSPSRVTFYENATTLCDGHARVTYSPAIPLTSNITTVLSSAATTSIYTDTNFYAYPSPSPFCIVNPSDCDALSASYSAAVASQNSRQDTAETISAVPTTTAMVLQSPSCVGVQEASSIAAAESAFSGCGECTMFGVGVELVYFPVPTTVSRDLCAITPSASLTWYGPNAVIEAYAGSSYSGKAAAHEGQETAVVGGHTFTSGTAYISISTVYAEDRCSATKGSPIHDVILAMPSESVLSLRYSQDHFQYFMTTATQTGFPVSYADFNQPIPWSAWNGQAMCTEGFGDYGCGVIYDNEYKPQLAIPPQIKDLSPDFAGCQLWYGGLYDPPLALTTRESIAPITLPGGATATLASSPSPGWGVTTAISTATALPEQGGGHEAWSHHFSHGSHSLFISASGMVAEVGSTPVFMDGPAQTLTDGMVATYGAQGLVITEQSSIPLPHAADSAETTVITYEQITVTAIQSGPDNVVNIASATLTPDGAAETITGDYVASAGSNGVVLGWATTIAPTDEAQAQSTQSGDGSSSTTPPSSETTASSTPAHSTSTTTAGGVVRNTVPLSASLICALLLACIVL